MSTSTCLDALIPPHENIPAKLARLSLNITTLTRLVDAAELSKLRFLTAMFERSRQSKVEQALTVAAHRVTKPENALSVHC